MRMTDVDAHGAADALSVSYSWFMRRWRTHRHAGTGALIPRPYVGGGRGVPSRWDLAPLLAWKAGAASAEVKAAEGPAQREPANDARPPPVSSRAAALLAAAGG